MKIVMIVLCLVLVLQLSATIINIPADQPTIQDGIDVSVNADTILVQTGTYVENINYIGKNITVASLFLTTQDTSYISQTIIDGNQNGSVVTFDSGEDSTAVLSGFTITNGNSNRGGGIYCIESDPILNNLVLCFNSAEEGGGISLVFCSNASLSSIILENNISSYAGYHNGGGGIYCQSSNLDMENIIIRNNSAQASGGGLFSIFTTLNIIDSEFTGNSCLYNGFGDVGGGGMYCYCSIPSMENVTFSNNYSGCNGGGANFNISDASLTNVSAANNSTVLNGGGFYFKMSDSVLNKVTAANNYTPDAGGGISIIQANIILTNVSIIDNLADSGGGICTLGSQSDLINCIFWNNEPQQIQFLEYPTPNNNVAISYTDIEGGLDAIVINGFGAVDWSEGNLNTDPLFIDPTNGDYHLLENSPCIDAGDPNYPVDPDGTIIDMGAYYYNQLTDIDDTDMQIQRLKLNNYPNPFNPTTTIVFSIKNNSHVELLVYNIKGQKIKSLTCKNFKKGSHSVIWYGDNEKSKSVSSGIYYYQLNVNGKTEAIKKCLLLK